MPSKKTSRTNSFSPSGELWLNQDGRDLLGESRIRLLEAIDKTGSITQAAKAAGISYKTAWDTLDLLNNLSNPPLMESATGGKKGGGSRLTEHGRELLKIYGVLRSEHEKYLNRLRLGFKDFDRFFKLSRSFSLKTSARNQLAGTVASIKRSPLNAEVALNLKGKDRIISHITLGGLENLGLRKGEDAYALIKANWISLAPLSSKSSSLFENRLQGKIELLREDAGHAEIVLRLKGGNTLVAAMTRKEAQKLKLGEGMEATALFKASDVILGVAY